ncbi:MAG: septum formation protein Maf [Sphingobacteriia bacterium]|nr:MAG: septum formation protein Maf [Sphingobacteriia bacterium]
MLQIQPLVLASQSPRRKQLLEWAEIPFEVVVSHADESFDPLLPPTEIPVQIARQKALAVQQQLASQGRAGQTILAADTIVVIGDKILNKPADRAEALEMLSSLSGKTHQVITGVVILQGTTETHFAATTSVRFHPLTQEQLCFYIDHYAPYDKAGAYAIQEWIGVVGIAAIEGDFYNVMGLPVSLVVQALAALNPPS